MGPIDRVDHVLSMLNQQENDVFLTQYPRHFAQLRNLSVGEITGFAFYLFSLGLISRKGKFSGSRQLQKFNAQFRDALHIEEASRCDVFLTFDKDASDLAASTLSYAGFSTQVVLLNKA